MTWLDGIVYGPIDAGPNTGLLAFHLYFNGLVPKEGDLVETITAIRNYPIGVAKHIYMRGFYPVEAEPYFVTLVKALKDSGYKIVAECDGQIYHTWFTMVDYLIVSLEESVWPAFACNEFRLNIPKEGLDDVPQLPPKGNLYTTGPYPKAQRTFIKKQKEPWAMCIQKICEGENVWAS